ncbi:MAG: hypothetical protein ACREPI_12355 [Candidatus Dormibacterales bacterium]
MFARLTHVQGTASVAPGQLEEAAVKVMGALTSMAGCRGVLWLIDREGDGGWAVTLFEDEAALADSRQVALLLSGEVVSGMGLSLVDVRECRVLDSQTVLGERRPAVEGPPGATPGPG